MNADKDKHDESLHLRISGFLPGAIIRVNQRDPREKGLDDRANRHAECAADEIVPEIRNIEGEIQDED